ncbi:MAG: sulfotransferase family 2 domain-containing protein [Saprospirales bacterium]|nr:sulfotransferase family 2 domain-containing protein [Saprospirales bacterium]
MVVKSIQKTYRAWRHELKIFLFTKILRRKKLHFIHIGKTGGTAVKEALKFHRITPKYVLFFYRHDFSLKDVPTGEKAFFFLRDPVQRYFSAFSDRKRKGLPRYYGPWSPEEEEAFSRFQSAEELASALGSSDPDLREHAEKAMKGIFHVQTHFWDWFGSREYFLSRLEDIVYVGFQESLEEDFARLKQLTGLPRELRLPEDETMAHRNTSSKSQFLSPESVENIRRWYRSDYEFMAFCRELIAAGKTNS